MTLLGSLLLLITSLSAPVIASESGPTDDRPAVQARLAAYSLLLDAVVAGNRLIAVGERGHILYSDDHGTTWRQAQVPTQATLTAVYFQGVKHGWAVGHDALILHTSDGGRSWQRQYSDPKYEAPLLDVWFKDADKGYAVGAYGLFLATDDGGKSWERKSISQDDFHLNAITAAPDGRLYIAAEAGHLYRSVDGGESWIALHTPYAGSYFGVLAPAGDRVLVYGLRGRFFRSENAGTTWQPIDSATTASLLGGAVLSNGRSAVVGLGGTVLLSEDNGVSFTRLHTSDRSGLAAVMEAGDGELILFGESGVSHYRPKDVVRPDKSQ